MMKLLRRLNKGTEHRTVPWDIIILTLITRPLSFGLNLGASTAGSVDNLSQTGSCTPVRTSLRKYTHSEYYMPRVIKYLKKEAKLMGLKPMGKDSNRSKDVVLALGIPLV